MNSHVMRILSIFAGTALVATAFGQAEPAMMVKQAAGQPISEPIPHNLCQPDGVALGGYDVVSYRQEGGPRLGSNDFSAPHNGHEYWFVNESNRTSFLQEPEQYLPEYNGFCAITLALGRVTCPQFKNFKIEDNRLLLFEVTGFTNGRTLWNSDPDGFRDKADNNFRQIAD